MPREIVGIYPSSLWNKIYRKIKDCLSRKNMLNQYGVYDGYKSILGKFYRSGTQRSLK